MLRTEGFGQAGGSAYLGDEKGEGYEKGSEDIQLLDGFMEGER